MSGSYWERHPDGPFVTLITVAATDCGPDAYDSACDDLKSPPGCRPTTKAWPVGCAACSSGSMTGWATRPRGCCTHFIEVDEYGLALEDIAGTPGHAKVAITDQQRSDRRP